MRKSSIFLQVALMSAALILFSCAGHKSFKTAENLMAGGKYDEAITHYNKALADKPGDLEFIIKLSRAKDAAAQAHYQRGRKFFDENNLEDAEKEFGMVLVLDPTYKRAFYALQEIKIKKESLESLNRAKNFAGANKIKEAYEEARKAYSLNPALLEAKQLVDQLSKTSSKSPLEYELNLKSTKPVSLKFKDAGIKEVFEVLSKLSGINFVFDETIRENKVTIFIDEASFVQALELILFTNKLAFKVVNQKNIIVYPDNKQKKKEYEEYYIRTFFLKYADAKKVVNTLRNLIEARQIFVNEETNAIIIRADSDGIELAEKIVESNDIAKPEVVLDLEFIEVNRNDLDRLGVDFSPYQIQAGFGKGNNPFEKGVVSSAFGATSNLVNVRDLEVAKLNRNILFTLPSITLNFLKQNGVTKALANPQLRALDGVKAQVHVGDRVPVITVTVSGVDQRSENVQYVDVGVKFNAEPKILSNDEIELKVDAEVSNIVSESKTQNGTTVYRIGTRNAKTTLRLKDGEPTVMGGLIQNRLEKTKSGLAFLSDIPVLGALFSSYSNKMEQSDIFISITPRISKGIIYPSVEATKIWSGTEDRLSSKPVLSSVVDGQTVLPEQVKDKTTLQKAEGELPAENIYAAVIGPESLKVEESSEADVIFSGVPPIVEFEISGTVNSAFLHPVKFTEAAFAKKEENVYRSTFDPKTGSFSVSAKLGTEMSGNFSVGRLEIKGRNKISNLELITLGQCRIKTSDGKVYNVKGLNAFMEVK